MIERGLEMVLASAAVLIVYAGARRLSDRVGHPPWASPVLVAAIIVGLGAWALGVPIADFTAATAPLRWLLQPALVALAVVVHANRDLFRRQALAVTVAIVGGTITGIASAVGFALLAGLDPVVIEALATKSVSTAFAVAIMTSVGGPVALAAAFAVVTGVIGALLVPPMFDRLGIRDAAARALGIGLSAHLVGTDWLSRRDTRAGGLAALAMVLAGTLAALMLPPLWRYVVAGR